METITSNHGDTHSKYYTQTRSSNHTFRSSSIFRGCHLPRTHRELLTVSQSVSLGVEPHLGLMTRYLLPFDRVTVLFLCGVLSNERTVLSFVYATGPRQRSISRVRVPLDSWPYFTVSDLKLPFSSPPTTRRVTVEIFEPAFTQMWPRNIPRVALYSLCADRTENSAFPVLCVDWLS
jgi:hypothetical protein